MTGKIERVTVPERRVFAYGFPSEGFSLKFVSGPDTFKELKPGSWLDTWALVDGMRQFYFGSFPKKNLVFQTKEEAIAAKEFLEKDLKIVTEVAE